MTLNRVPPLAVVKAGNHLCLSLTAVLHDYDQVLCYILPDRRKVHTVLDRSDTNSCWQLGVILGPLSIGFSLKTCINTFILLHVFRICVYILVMCFVLPTA